MKHWLAIAGCMWVLFVRADTVILKSGERLKGKVVQENDSVLILELLPGMNQEVSKSDIASRSGASPQAAPKAEVETKGADAPSKEQIYDVASNYACDHGVIFEGLKRAHALTAVRKFLDLQVPGLREIADEVAGQLATQMKGRFSNFVGNPSVNHDLSIHTSHRDTLMDLKKGLLRGFPDRLEDIRDSWVEVWSVNMEILADIEGRSARASVSTYTRVLLLFDAKDDLKKAYRMSGQDVYLTPSSASSTESRQLVDASAQRWSPYKIMAIEKVHAKAMGKSSPDSGDHFSPDVSGTGFFVTKDGYLLTNHHVVKDAKSVTIQKDKERFAATIVKTDPENDMALLKVEGTFTPLPLGDSESVKLGMAICTVGFPNIDIQGEQAKFTKGEISALTGMQDDPKFFQVSAPVQPGNSGGALLSEDGSVVGIVTSRLGSLHGGDSETISQNVNYAVKINLAQPLLEGIEHPKAASFSPKKWTDLAHQAEVASALVLVELKN